SIIPLPPSSSLFPYTTLFRSTRPSGCAAAQPTYRQVRSSRNRPCGSIAGSGRNNRRQRQSKGSLVSALTLHFDVAAVKSHDFLRDRKSTRLNSSHLVISYAVF